MQKIIWSMPVFVLAASIYLGSFENNYFIGAGLSIIIIASIASITLSTLNALKAAKAKKVEFDSYLPKSESTESRFFKYTTTINGTNTNDPIPQIRQQILEIQNVAIQDEKTFRSLLNMTNYRIDIALARQNYHEEVAIPQIIGAGTGVVILAGILSIIGSIYLAFPDKSYVAFAQIANEIHRAIVLLLCLA